MADAFYLYTAIAVRPRCPPSPEPVAAAQNWPGVELEQNEGVPLACFTLDKIALTIPCGLLVERCHVAVAGAGTWAVASAGRCHSIVVHWRVRWWCGARVLENVVRHVAHAHGTSFWPNAATRPRALRLEDSAPALLAVAESHRPRSDTSRAELHAHGFYMLMLSIASDEDEDTCRRRRWSNLGQRRRRHRTGSQPPWRGGRAGWTYGASAALSHFEKKLANVDSGRKMVKA
uniref:Uncharacterized protein n=1 Tax=Oryza glumipatula TaxID=40148 RepID=A0A0E0BDN8_9ORYZ